MAPKKKVQALIKLQIQAGAATPAPPVGPALGQHGVNIMDFVKQYNAATENKRAKSFQLRSLSMKIAPLPLLLRPLLHHVYFLKQQDLKKDLQFHIRIKSDQLLGSNVKILQP
jgi:hypothetical protein